MKNEGKNSKATLAVVQSRPNLFEELGPIPQFETKLISTDQLSQLQIIRPYALLLSYDTFKAHHSEILNLKIHGLATILCYTEEHNNNHAVSAIKFGADYCWYIGDIDAHVLTDATLEKEVYEYEVHLLNEQNTKLRRQVSRFSEQIAKETKYFVDANTELRKEVDKRKAQEISYSERIDRLSSYLENSPVAIVEWDLNFEIISWSKKAEEIFGWTSEEIVGDKLPADNFTHPDDKYQVSKCIKKLFDKKERQNVSFNRNITKEGKIIYCEWYNTAIYNDQNEIDVILSVIQDVTAFKLFEKELMASQQRFKQLSHASFDAIIIHNEGIMEDCNQKFLDTFDVTYDDCFDQDIAQFFTPYSKKILKSFVYNNADQHYEIVGVKADGSQFPIEVISKPIKYEEKDARLIAIRDITQRKKVENKLFESEERFRATFEQASIGIAHISLDGLILRTNNSFGDIYGFNMSDLKGLPVKDFLKEIEVLNLDRDKLNKIFKGVINDEVYEKQIIAKDGRQIWTSTSVSMVSENKDMSYLMVVSTDITQKKSIEEELKNAHNELDTFVYSASHDLRGPIATLIGLCDIGMIEFQDRKVTKHISMMSETAHKLNRILTSLLFINDLKERSLKIKKVDFESILKGYEETYRTQGLLDNVNFETHIEPNELYTDSELVSDILQNTLDNAIKYAQFERGRESFVRVSVFPSDDAHVTILIEDNGIGIVDNVKDKVFKMFFKGTEYSKGLGLGLYITKCITQKLSGTVALDSQYLEGTKITIVLPSFR